MSALAIKLLTYTKWNLPNLCSTREDGKRMPPIQQLYYTLSPVRDGLCRDTLFIFAGKSNVEGI